MGYEWDPWYLRRLFGIEPYEVMQALYDDRPRLPQSMRSAEGLLVPTVWCRTRSGRPLVVALGATEKPFDWLIRGGAGHGRGRSRHLRRLGGAPWLSAARTTPSPSPPPRPRSAAPSTG